VAAVVVVVALLAPAAWWWWPAAPAPTPSAAGAPPAGPASVPGTAPGGSSVLPVPGPPPGPGATAAAPPPPAFRQLLAGTVNVPVHVADVFATHHGDFLLELRDARSGRVWGDTPLQPDGGFALRAAVPAGAATPELELSWTWRDPGRHALWPVRQTVAGTEAALTFEQVDNLLVLQKSAMLRDVQAGRFRDADERLRTFEQLLDMYGAPDQPVLPGFTRDALHHKLLQEVCSAAANHRDTVGRSRVSDEMLDAERRWRKRQFAAARGTARPAVDLARALNAWARFSREAYSLQQRAWTDRAPLADPQALRIGPTHATWLREDLAAVSSQLLWLRDAPEAEALRRRLDAPQRALLQRWADGPDDTLPLSRLANLLSTLAGA
jgi:hypothetical protein